MKEKIKSKGRCRVVSMLRVLALVGVVMTAATSYAQSNGFRVNGGSVTAIGGTNGGDAIGGDNMTVNAQSYITVKAGINLGAAQIYQGGTTLTEWLKGKAYANMEVTKYQVTARIHKEGWGTVKINNVATPTGSYSYGDKLTLKAEPNENYAFVGWFTNDSTQMLTSNAEMQYTVAEGDVTFLAVFTDHVSISLSAKPEDFGDVEFIQGSELVPCGSTVIVKATPADGFAFKGWFNTATGEMVCGKNTYEFKAAADVSLEARFTDDVIWVRVKKQ